MNSGAGVLLAGGFAFFSALILTPLVRRLAIEVGCVSKPTPDRWGHRAIARLGGISIAFGFLGVMIWEMRYNRQLIGLLAALVLMFLTGLVDDYKRMHPYTKLILQIVAGCIVLLFDIEFTYGFAFETTNLENLKEAQRATKRRGPPLPREPIRLMFKGYVPELIEYFHVAEKVDYLPFKFICYFHVLEYFMDKSAYSVVSRKVKQLLLSPDFHLKSSEYIANAVNIIKLETERNTTDKIKIGRVIGEFAQSDTIQSHLTSISMLTHFTREHTLACAKPLKLSAIAFDSEKSYLESVAKRIYAVRCSIVHSNPDFDESKAVPFLPTPKNIEFLRTEIELIREISRTIICNTAA